MSIYNYFHKTSYSLYEAKQWTLEALAKCKTTSSKKAYLTRSIKKLTEYINDITEAIATGKSRGENFGWFLGDKYTNYNLKFYTKELEMQQQLRKELNGEIITDRVYDITEDTGVMELVNDLIELNNINHNKN